MKEKNSKTVSSNNSDGKDESDSGRTKAENKSKEVVSKLNGKAGSASDTRLTDIHSQELFALKR